MLFRWQQISLLPFYICKKTRIGKTPVTDKGRNIIVFGIGVYFKERRMQKDADEAAFRVICRKAGMQLPGIYKKPAVFLKLYGFAVYAVIHFSR